MLLSTKNLKLKVLKKKLATKYLGPYRIIRRVGAQAYRLALPSNFKIYNIFYISLLEP